MAVIFSDDFFGLAGTIEGRVVSGHTWHVYQGTVALDGSGEVVMRSSGIAYVQMPEIVGELDYEVEFTVATAYDLYLAAGIRNGPITPLYTQLVNDFESLVVLPGTALVSVISGLPALQQGDVATMRVQWSTGMFTLLVNGVSIATVGLSQAATDPYIVIASTNTDVPTLDPGLSSVVVRTLEAPTPSSFWTNLSGAREVI